jgi:hypothetical protein
MNSISQNPIKMLMSILLVFVIRIRSLSEIRWNKRPFDIQVLLKPPYCKLIFSNQNTQSLNLIISSLVSTSGGSWLWAGGALPTKYLKKHNFFVLLLSLRFFHYNFLEGFMFLPHRNF